MKKVYFISSDTGALESKEVADDYVLQSNELPEQGKLIATSDAQKLSQLALQQAQFQVSQQKLNSQLALQLAQLTAKEVQNV